MVYHDMACYLWVKGQSYYGEEYDLKRLSERIKQIEPRKL